MMTIDADMSASGRLAVLGAVALEGRFEGEIVCARLEIGPDGYLLGDAIAGEVVVAGQIVGSVRAGHVHLLTTAILEGEVSHLSLRMDGAATLVGESRRHKSFEMPADFLALQRKALQNEDDMRTLELHSRIRRLGAAAGADAEFHRLRERFPVPAA